MNKSGIEPAGNRVLVKPDPVKDEMRESLIHIPETIMEKHQTAQALGTLIYAGPDAFTHAVERKYIVHGKGERELVEETVRGYNKPFASVGDRVAYAEYSGRDVLGEDGEKYRIINDEDITARVSKGVAFSNLKPREGTRANKGLSA